MRDKIIDKYKILLAVGWMEADDEDNVSVRMGGDLMPATINGKRVILPSRAQLKNTNWDNRIGFHPIREQYNLGVSDILSSLRDQYVSRLNTTIGYFMKELIDIAFDQDNQKKLTSAQGQVLNALPKASATTVKSFKSLLEKTSAHNNIDQFINIRIQRAGVVGGVTYGRAGIVTFPIYEQLTRSKDEPVNGVTISNKDRAMFIKLYEYILPSLLIGPEAFSVGVSSRGAPFLEALVRCSFNVIGELVERIKPYMDLVTLPFLLQFPEDMGYWIEVFDSKDMVERLASVIPSMNEFTVEPEDKPVVKEEVRKEYRKSVEERPVEAATDRQVAAAPSTTEKRSFWSKAGTTLAERAVSATPTKSATSSTDSSTERSRREEADRERREQERRREAQIRQEENERRREDDERRRRRDEEDRIRDRQRRDEDRDRGRNSRDDRDYYDDRRDRDRDSRDDRGRTGDVFEDNPNLRRNSRDSRDDRDYYDRDRGRRPRDIRDRGRDSRDDRDYYDRDDRDYRRRR